MKCLVTGLSGTLAPVFARVAARHGIDILRWDRQLVAPEAESAARAFLKQEQPDAIAHLAVGSVEWARLLALYAAQSSVPLLFTSTAMVFHHHPDGPHRVGDERNAQDPYGRYKRECEDAVLNSYPKASVARVGWQIDWQQPGNNMLMALDQWQAKEGCISASETWRPACSFMEDTAGALVSLLREAVPGITHIDSNAAEGHTFLSIVSALKHVCRRDAWRIEPTREYVHDQRLVGGDVLVPGLSERLPPLRRTECGDA
jgi:dTDP-4-dehydrorhamnose reductase